MTALAFSLLAPAVAALAIAVLRRGAAVLALAGAAGGWVAAVRLLAAAAQQVRYELILPGLPGMPLRLVSEPLTALLAVLVATVGGLVLVFAVGYMRADREQPRFFALMMLFVAAMQTLVLAGDWVLLLAAWELIGLSSYLLIGFWFQREGVAGAATRAFLYTRSADIALYLAVFVLIARSGTSEIAPTLTAGGATAVTAGALLLVAAMGKSAQTPLHDWLQRAMVGPTPVSALLHSATLVAAGAILLIRSAPMLPPAVLLAVGAVGGLTAVVAGLIALGEHDLKRMLAASTSSQYGLILVAVGAGAPVAALVHLVAHAAMKSALFLGAGVFQHAREGTGFAELAGVGRERRLVFLGFVVAGLALAGAPPLSGFFTKDAIIAAALASAGAPLLVPLVLAGTLLSGAYVARALRILWRGEVEDRPLPGARWMGGGLTGLALLAAVLGLAVEPMGRLLGSALPAHGLAPILGLAAAASGLALGWWLRAEQLLGPLQGWAAHGFAVAGGFDRVLARPVLALAAGCERLERGLYAGALAVGRMALAVAAGGEHLERALYAGVLAVGRMVLTVAGSVRLADERGIDGIIMALVRGMRALGTRVRALQTGLVHRELMLAAAGAAMILAALLTGLAGF